MRATRIIASLMLASVLVVGGVAGPAMAKKLQKPKITIKLDAQRFDSGSDVTGTTRLWVKDHKVKVGVPNEVLGLQVDGVDVGTTTTDADGYAAIVISGVADGQHILNVVFAGDGSYRAADKQHGFCVGTNCN